MKALGFLLGGLSKGTGVLLDSKHLCELYISSQLKIDKFLPSVRCDLAYHQHLHSLCLIGPIFPDRWLKLFHTSEDCYRCGLAFHFFTSSL